jgi:hypothetical protein
MNHPDVLADIARQHHAEMIAAADEFRRAEPLRRLRRLRKRRWKLGTPRRQPAGTTASDEQEAIGARVIGQDTLIQFTPPTFGAHAMTRLVGEMRQTAHHSPSGTTTPEEVSAP